MHQDILSPIGHEVTISRHLQIAGIFTVERHRDHGAAVKIPALAMREFDDVAEPQLPEQRQIVIEEFLSIPTTGDDDRDILRHMQQRARVHMIVMVMRQEDRSRLRQ